MSSWLAHNWYMIWALVVTSAFVAYRMRKRGGEEPMLRRVIFALFPYSDPRRVPQQQLSMFTATLLGGGVLAVVLAYLLFLQSE